MDRSLDYSLTTIVSSAGFGKTTAVVTWARSLDEVPVAWFLLDAGDCTLDRFWLYLTAALRIADKRICHAFDAMRLADDAEAMKPAIDTLIIQMAEYERDFVCVLEDFHTVQGSEGINDSMRYFMKHIPRNAHFVITSRHALRFPTSKMRVEGCLNEISEEDLCFTEEQTAEFFSALGFAFDREAVSEIHEITRGWPTGNRLVSLLGTKGSQNIFEELIERAKGSINDYLFEEVFQELPEGLQRFMVQTSVVGSFCLPLAERITGCSQGEAQANLDYLVENNLFVEKVERETGEDWYRYHLLLAEMLHKRLGRVDRGEAERIRRMARDWFEENGFLDYVVELSARIGDFEKIKMVIIENWMSAYMADSHYSIIRWASFLPDEEILKSPMVCAVVSMPYALSGMPDKADLYIANAMSRLHGEEDFLYALCMAEQAYLASFRSDSDGMRLYADKALERLPEKEFYLRGMMCQVRAAACYEDDPLVAKSAFLKAIELQRGYGNKTLTCSAYCNFAAICADLGYLVEAHQYNDAAFDLYEPNERRFKPMLSYAYLTDMICSYEAGDFDQVLLSYSMFESVSSEGIVPEKLAEAKAIRAKTLYRKGGSEGKPVFFEAMKMNEAGALDSYPTFSMVKDYCEAFRTKAEEHSGACAKKRRIRVFEYVVAYHLDHVSCYEDLCAYAEDIDENERYIKVYALFAAAIFSEKVARYGRAQAYLGEALARCAEYGFCEMARGNAAYLQPIAKRMASCIDAPSLLHELVDGLSEQCGIRLTERESDVMKLIAAGMTVTQAAERMFVSRDTVKKHLANVYAKLGVHSKMQAVALLRDQGIV